MATRSPPAVPPQAYRWSVTAGRYTDTRGRFVSRREVTDALDSALDSAKNRGRALSEQLRAGTIGLREWEQSMRGVVKEVHLYSAATARGGWAQMSYTDFGNVGPAMRFQYGRLHKFAKDIEGGYPLDGRFMQRTELYMLSGRSSFHKQDETVQRELGMSEERNILHARDHCAGCVGETGRGWVLLGTLVAPGNRDCLSRCRCTVEYRKPEEAAPAPFPLGAPPGAPLQLPTQVGKPIPTTAQKVDVILPDGSSHNRTVGPVRLLEDGTYTARVRISNRIHDVTSTDGRTWLADGATVKTKLPPAVKPPATASVRTPEYLREFKEKEDRTWELFAPNYARFEAGGREVAAKVLVGGGNTYDATIAVSKWVQDTLRAERAAQFAGKKLNYNVVGQNVSAAFRTRVEDALRIIPDNVHEALVANEATLTVGDRLTTMRPDLKGVRPRGYPPGSTWDNSSGVAAGRNTYVSEFYDSLASGLPTRSDRTFHTVAHELGHAWDFTRPGGIPYRLADDFLKAYRSDVRLMKKTMPAATREKLAYFLQEGSSGPAETIAEGFARIIGAGEDWNGYEFDSVFKKSIAFLRKAIKETTI